MMSTALKSLALTMFAGAIAASSPAAFALEGPVAFGGPTVLSMQGQRLKVVVPVQSPAGDRASASTFMVRETEVPFGFQPLATRGFTVMRPAAGEYVVFQSAEVVTAPEVSLIVSVAGDPSSPYRMDLQVPAATISSPLAANARTGTPRTLPTRILRGPKGDPGLPPK